MKKSQKNNSKSKIEEDKSMVAKNYFSILKDFEKRKDEILPKKKPYKPKKTLKEKIYNNYSNKLGDYYKTNKSRISLYGSKKYENLSIDELVEEMGQYKKTILKKIKDNPELYSANMNFPHLTDDNKIILTPLPIEQKNKKLKIDNDEFYKAERTGVVMRTIEYTNRLGKRDFENNQNIFFVMKNAVDKITKFWKNNNNKENIRKYHIRKGIQILKKISCKKYFMILKKFYNDFQLKNKTYFFINKKGFNRLFYWNKIIYLGININKSYIMSNKIKKFLKNRINKIIGNNKINKPKKKPLLSYQYFTKTVMDLKKIKMLQNNILDFLNRKTYKINEKLKINTLSSSIGFPLKILKIKPYLMTKTIKYIKKEENILKKINLKKSKINFSFNENNIISLPLRNGNNSYITKIRSKSPILKKANNYFQNQIISNDINFKLSQDNNYYKKYSFYFIKTILKILFGNFIKHLRDYNKFRLEKVRQLIKVKSKVYLRYYFLIWINKSNFIYNYTSNIKKIAKYPKPTFRLKAFTYSKSRKNKNKINYQLYFAFTLFRNYIFKKIFNSFKNFNFKSKIKSFIFTLKFITMKEFFYRLILNSLIKNNININNKEIISLLKFGSNKNFKYNKRLGKILNLNLTNNSEYDNSTMFFNEYVKKLLLIQKKNREKSDSEISSETEKIDVSNENIKIPNFFEKNISKKKIKEINIENNKNNNLIDKKKFIENDPEKDNIYLNSPYNSLNYRKNEKSTDNIKKIMIPKLSNLTLNNSERIINYTSKSLPKKNDRITIVRNPKNKDKVELRDIFIYDFPY